MPNIVNVCSRRMRLSKDLRGDICADQTDGGHSLLNMLRSRHFTSQVFSQTSTDAWRAIGSAFMVAVATLPQPFAIVEAGNLCGATTILLAILKRRLCPSCRLYSLDPGDYRAVMGQPRTCALKALSWSGLLQDVELIDSISGILVTELPVGFIYLDDGKSRFANDPLISGLREKLMIGSIIAADDTWAAATMPHSRDHFGQVMLLHELVEGGDFAPLFVPMPRENKSFLEHLYRRRATGDLTPRLDRLVQLATSTSGPGRGAWRGSPFRTHKISAVVRLAPSSSDSGDGQLNVYGDSLRVSMNDAEGHQHALETAQFPQRGQPPPYVPNRAQ